MNQNYFNEIQSKALNVACKAQGLAYLLSHLKPNSSGMRDQDAFIGLGLILEDLADESRQISERLDCVRRPI